MIARNRFPCFFCWSITYGSACTESCTCRCIVSADRFVFLFAIVPRARCDVGHSREGGCQKNHRFDSEPQRAVNCARYPLRVVKPMMSSAEGVGSVDQVQIPCSAKACQKDVIPSQRRGICTCSP